MSHMPFKKLSAMLGKQKGVTNPEALAAALARKKYGDKAVQEHAANGTSMAHVKPLKKK